MATPATPILILTDEHGAPQGLGDYHLVHREGLLHQAFSIYVFRHAGRELLIQRRSGDKWLWPGVWANTCCSHPREGEDLLTAAARRLEQECGFSCALRVVGSFTYRAEDPGGRGIEHEHDQLLVGEIEGPVTVRPDPREVAEWRWVEVEILRQEMARRPGEFAPWLHFGLPQVLERIRA